MKKLLLLSCMGFLLVSCAGNKADDTAPVTVGPPAANIKAPETPKITFAATDYAHTTPVQFIDYLKSHEADGWITVEKAPDNWITRKDVDELMKLIRSTDPCAGVVLGTSNIIPPANVRSSVGVEALLLLESYRKGSYPAYLSSLDYAKALTPDPGTKQLRLKPGANLVDEINAWYNNLK